MELTRYIPKLGGLPELRIFMCIDCGTVTINECETQDLKTPLSIPRHNPFLTKETQSRRPAPDEFMRRPMPTNYRLLIDWGRPFVV